MKIYISADIEGVAGIAHLNEILKSNPENIPFSEEMTKEVQAACEGANNAGAAEIWIKDAHGTGRNMGFAGLPSNIKFIRSCSGHPFDMMQELDSSFDAVFMIGYHSYAGSDGSPLAHTMSGEYAYIKINGVPVSEFLLNAYIASMVGVPVVFVSGDADLSRHVKQINSNIKTVEVYQGVGDSVISIHPDAAFGKIKEGAEAALKSPVRMCMIPLPDRFEVEVSFKKHAKAYKASFYPGMQKISPNTLLFKTSDYFDVMRMIMFIT